MRSVLQSLFLICLGAALALAMVVLYQGAGGAHPGSQRADLRALQDHFRKLSSNLAPSVVAIRTRSVTASRGITVEGSGSGFAFGAAGMILTNEHVVQGAGEIYVVLSDSRRLQATLVGSDSRSDLAVLKIPASLPPLRLREIAEVHEGDWVAAMGNPFGQANEDGRSVFSAGMVNKFGVTLEDLWREDDRHYSDMIETSAPIHLGSSGGPLVDLDGQVVGINTAVQQTLHDSATPGQPVTMENVGFAIPFTPRTLDVIQKLCSGQQVRYGWLGVTVGARVFRDGSAIGVLAASVQPGGPAEAAGLKDGDIITHLNDSPVQTADQLVRDIGACTVGEQSVVRILRNDSENTLRAVVGDRGTQMRLAALANSFRWRGLAMQDIPEGGASVVSVEPDSPAGRAGIIAGDVVTAIGQRTVGSVQQFRSLITPQRGEVAVTLRDGRSVAVPRR